ncbi:MAG TPA: hypothetical protein VNJ01_10195 [Bacteriovoracaceae bacterium]|nr:hypothetical protein [Bacteriovoracaceae bacterium]
MKKLTILMLCLVFSIPFAVSKVEKPNYDFSLDTLSDFFPEKLVSELDKKYGKPEVMNEKYGVQTLKYYVAQIRYKFPVILQAKDGIVLDFFARLPNYFLHDVFFQSLINRQGKQDAYKKIGEEAVYTWDKKPLQHVYSAACTITCFPIFYSVFPAESSTPALIMKMKEAYKGSD